MNASITPSTTASLFLRRVLLADAIVSGGVGLLLLLGAGPLGDLLGLPPALLRWIGPTLLPWAALLAYLGTRERIAAPPVWTVIAINLLWVVASLLLLVSGRVAPTALGYAFVLVQAVAVAGFAELQYLGLRKVTPA